MDQPILSRSLTAVRTNPWRRTLRWPGAVHWLRAVRRQRSIHWLRAVRWAHPLRWVAAGSLCVILAIGAVYAHWVYRDHRLTVISPGVVYQSAAMSPQEITALTRDLNIQTVIDFRGPSDRRVIDAEHAALGRRGVRYLNIPSSQVPDPETVAAFVTAMKDEVASRRTVLLHCNDGEGRAVFYSAIYRMEFEGWNNESAYLATTRLPPELMFLRTVFPGIARLSIRNPKTPMILGYRAQQPLRTQPALRAQQPLASRAAAPVLALHD